MNNNKKIVKYTSGITALALTFSLGMSGCSSSDSEFKFTENEKGEIVVEEDSYIKYEYLNNYYVVEVYNSILDTNEIYIAEKIMNYRKYNNSYNSYKNIFNGFVILYDENEYNNNIKFIKETSLVDYLITYDLVKYRYTYEDMENVYNFIKENYRYENDSALRRKLVIDNII